LRARRAFALGGSGFGFRWDSKAPTRIADAHDRSAATPRKCHRRRRPRLRGSFRSRSCPDWSLQVIELKARARDLRRGLPVTADPEVGLAVAPSRKPFCAAYPDPRPRDLRLVESPGFRNDLALVLRSVRSGCLHRAATA